MRKSRFTEEQITMALRQGGAVRTGVDADRVLVVERGRLVADGTHSELMRGSSVYRDLVETQLVRD